jgi:hypothetical protein
MAQNIMASKLREFDEIAPPEPELFGMWLSWSELEALANCDEPPRSLVYKAHEIVEAIKNGTFKPRTF